MCPGTNYPRKVGPGGLGVDDIPAFNALNTESLNHLTRTT